MAKDNAIPRFFMEAVERFDKDGNRTYIQEERVEIIMPGVAHLNKPVLRVNNDHKERWPDQYAAFKRGETMAVDGTPIEEWPLLNVAMVKFLKTKEISTVEQCAELSDTAVQQLGMGGYSIREKAKAFIDDREAVALVEKVTRENDSLRIEVGTLRNQVKELSDRFEEVMAQRRAEIDRPSALATMIPGMADANYGKTASEEVAGNPLDTFAKTSSPPRRRRTEALVGTA